MDSVSIIIPTFNRHHMLCRALKSIERQTLIPFEVIVVNDGEYFDPSSIYSTFKSIDVKVIEGKKIGVASARNAGIESSAGKWILFLDDDDELKPGYIEHVVNKLGTLEHEDVFLWCWVEVSVLNENGEVKEAYVKSYADKVSPRGLDLATAVGIGCGYGFLTKKTTLDQVGRFRTRLTVCEDTDLILRLLAGGFTPRVCEVIGVSINEHQEYKLNNGPSTYGNSEDLLNVIRFNYDFIKKSPAIAGGFLGWALHIYLCQKSYFVAFCIAGMMIRSNPFSPWIWKRIWRAIQRL